MSVKNENLEGFNINEVTADMEKIIDAYFELHLSNPELIKAEEKVYSY